MARLLALALFAVSVVGCYTLQPSRGGLPPVGSRVAFDVTDSGRLVLGGAMGPEIAQVEGRLVSKEDTAYVLAVSAIRLLRGGEQVWRGEQVRLRREHVATAYVRRFSTGRSVVVGTTVVGGFAAFLITRALRGEGDERGGRNPGDTAQTQRGRPR
jgi:hypothetical protein